MGTGTGGISNRGGRWSTSSTRRRPAPWETPRSRATLCTLRPNAAVPEPWAPVRRNAASPRCEAPPYVRRQRIAHRFSDDAGGVIRRRTDARTPDLQHEELDGPGRELRLVIRAASQEIVGCDAAPTELAHEQQVGNVPGAAQRTELVRAHTRLIEIEFRSRHKPVQRGDRLPADREPGEHRLAATDPLGGERAVECGEAGGGEAAWFAPLHPALLVQTNQVVEERLHRDRRRQFENSAALLHFAQEAACPLAAVGRQSLQVDLESPIQIGDRASAARNDSEAPATVDRDSRRKERRAFGKAEQLDAIPRGGVEGSLEGCQAAALFPRRGEQIHVIGARLLVLRLSRREK